MKNVSPEVDAYIARSAPFAQAILKRLRKLFHRASPEIRETLKWGFPHFERRGIVGSMAAFKEHVSFGFWKGTEIDDPQALFERVGKTGMIGLKVERATNLPPDHVLLGYIRQAVRLDENGAAASDRAPKPRKAATALNVPDDLSAALRLNKRANAAFERFSPSHRNEYVEWVNDAKRAATRERRIAQTIEWLAQGKSRNWKYI